MKVFKKIAVLGILVFCVPLSASALQYWELFAPQVLGETTYAPQAIVNNRSLVISVKPLDFKDNKWNYEITWNRTLDKEGSIFLNNSAVAAITPKQGSAPTGFTLNPKARNKLEFYSQPNKKGLLLARKYFTSLPEPSAPPSQPAASAPSCPSLSVNAFTACYYAGRNFETFKATSTISAVNFDWGRNSPAASVPIDNFSASFEGSFSFENSDYTFTLTGDDGIRLYVDEQLIIDKWKGQSATTYTAVKNLSAGSHKVKLLYFEAIVDAVVKLSWAKKLVAINNPPVVSNPPASPPPSSPPATPPPPSNPPASQPVVNVAPSGNGVVIRSISGQSEKKTFSISRIFAKGEIPNFPKARISGSATETQADVMTRYEDGSVKHSIVSFVANLPANGSLPVDFINQNSCNCGENLALTREQMLSGEYGFNAEIETVKDGVVQKVNARQMLENGDFRYWLKGPLATQIILEDRSQALKYDFGYKNSNTFIATPNGYFRTGETSMEVLDSTNIPVPSIIKLYGERMRVCGKTATRIQFGISSCPNIDGRKYGGTSETGAAWGVLAQVEGQTGWRAAENSKYKSLHPIFVATFTPKTPESTKVEMILENMWTQKLQDQYYDVNLKVGSNLATVFTGSNVNHTAMTRWRKVFYSGQTPGAYYIDYNLPYLVYSKAIPNYNTNVSVSENAIRTVLETGYTNSHGLTPGWRNSNKGDFTKNKDGNFHGQIYKSQFAPGGRPDIGLFPTWQTTYLFAMGKSDSRVAELYDAVIGNGEAGNQFPFLYRESKSGKAFVSGMSSDMFGKVMSIDARPKTYSNFTTRDSADQGGDTIFLVDSVDTLNFQVDPSHEPAYFYIPYIISGDWYFLESQYALASYDLMHSNPNNRVNEKGILNGQERQIAWSLRSLAEAAYIAPDNTPEKKLFTDKLINNIAVREGSFNITNGAFYKPCSTNPFNKWAETSLWCIGKNQYGSFPNPLYFFAGGISMGEGGGEADPSKTSRVFAGFMYGYLHVTLGHIEELGFSQVSAFRERFGQNLLGQLLDPAYSPYYIQNYRTPSYSVNNSFFQSWAEVKDAILPQYRQSKGSSFQNDGDYDGGYSIISYGAASFVANYNYQGKSGKQAWNFLVSNIRNQEQFADNQKWNFIPR